MAENCKLYEDLLVQEALGEITERDRAFLKAHLESCGDCRTILAGLADTLGVVRRDQPERAPAGLAQRTLKRVEQAADRFVAASSAGRQTALLSPSSWRVRKSLVGWMVAASVMFMAVASLVPGMRGIDERRDISLCQDRMRVIATALRQYARDHSGFYPQGPEWHKALDYEYLQRVGVLLHPGRLAVGARSAREIDYLYNPTRVGMSASDDYPLLWDNKHMHEGGRNVLRADGTIAWIADADFERLLMRYKIDELDIFRQPTPAGP